MCLFNVYYAYEMIFPYCHKKSSYLDRKEGLGNRL